ncbi:hypothetical protein Aglo01_45290 [Actinokineospora globicatena]|nr:hypothetical protein Aglo01_45290 [Actinokineospora globicatena]GLW86877.1 hypothetical protein Aglo02_45160 [Actinokineospora globicatena]
MARTIVPLPGLVSTSPASRSVAITLVAVAIATPHLAQICRVDGIRSPWRNRPLKIHPRISAAIVR